MKKENELLYLSYENGWIVAYMYNRERGYYHHFNFLYYTKKEVIYKLRHEHDCIVSRESVNAWLY